jgi:hypothetical protein
MNEEFPKVDKPTGSTDKPVDPLTKYLQNETKPQQDPDSLPTGMGDDLLEYLTVDLNALPAGIFYKPGTKVLIRAATVEEVQAYSAIVNDNLVDVTEKMNEMLSRCVKIKFPNGTIGGYKDVKDNDRIFLIFMIRELTFQKNVNLAKDVKCECGHEFKIQFRATPTKEYPKTFVNYEVDESLKKFFNQNDRTFDFNVNGKVWKIAPPSISIQESFFKVIKDTVQAGGKPNVSFMKIIPYTLTNLKTISDEGIKAKEEEFKKGTGNKEQDMDTFQFLNQAVEKLQFGIKELQAKCPSCGEEVHTDFTFPEGASNIFIIPSVFDKFTKK